MGAERAGGTPTVGRSTGQILASQRRVIVVTIDAASACPFLVTQTERGPYYDGVRTELEAQQGKEEYGAYCRHDAESKPRLGGTYLGAKPALGRRKGDNR